MNIERLTTYTPETATRIRELLTELSRSGKDKGEIAKEWFDDVIASPWHDLLIARDDTDKIVGIASVSVIMGPGIGKNAYLEDFVVDSTTRKGGIGSALWNEMLKWAKEKGCKRMEFTCGNGREIAQTFYKNHGADLYDTNFFRVEL